jgi:pimeloyl-ACP methyl ester carboxylesterase
MMRWPVLVAAIAALALMFISSSNTVFSISQSKAVMDHDFTVQLPEFLTKAKLSWPTASLHTAMPLVLLIHAGNPSDMDATFFNNNSVISNNFLQITDFFNQNGIAVLRYNKRFVSDAKTIDQSRYQRLDLADFANDARTVLLAAQQQAALAPLFKVAKPVIVGWSEGAAVTMQLANAISSDLLKLHGLVLLSPPTVVAGKDYGTLALAPHLKIPLLLLQGEGDTITKASETRRLLALFPQNLVQSGFYPGLSHSLGDPSSSQFAPISPLVLQDLAQWIHDLK